MPPSRGSRMPSGLDPQHNVVDDAAHASVEHLIVDDEPRKHSTRVTRAGRPNVSYDMKYHPMDAVTRPNMPATQRNRSKSVGFVDDLEDDSDVESPPSSSQTASGSDGPVDSSDSNTIAVRGPPPAKRKKDSRASRHSSRKEAQKFVDYDSKSHPCDYGIPGYKHRVKYTPPTDKDDTSQKQKKRRSDSPGSGDAQPPMPPRHPRKKLKSLGSASSNLAVQTARKRGRGRPREKQHQNASDEINELVEEAIRGSQRIPPLISSVADSDDLDDDIALVFGGNDESASAESGNSSNALDVTTPECSTLASSHKIPDFIHNRHAFKHGAVPLTTDVAFSMLLEDFRSDHDVELKIIKPYVGPTRIPSQIEALSPRAGGSAHHSLTQVREAIPDSEDEEQSSENHFAEEIAITEPRENHGSDGSVLGNLPLLSSGQRFEALQDSGPSPKY